MDPAIITKTRQIITQNMPVVNYDKNTINTVIESVYTSLTNSDPLPDKGLFSQEQFEIIVNVIQSLIDNSNQPPTPQLYNAESARLKIALSRIGLLSTVNTAIAQVNQEIQIWWEYAINFDMYDSRVQNMASVLNLTQEQLKQLWDLANSIE